MSKMRRYLVFAGHDYESNGGWNDFQDSWSSWENAHANALGLTVGLHTQYEWWQIVDIETGEVTES